MGDGFGFAREVSAASGLHQAGSVTWDNAELRELVLSEAQYFQDAFSTHLVPDEYVHSAAFVAGVIPVLRQYVVFFGSVDHISCFRFGRSHNFRCAGTPNGGRFASSGSTRPL